MQSILLLHGAIGASDQLLPLKENLSNNFDVHVLDFSGHGGKPYANQPFSIQLFAKEVLCYLDEHSIASIDMFGYSMGGYVAMYLAKHHSDRVGKVITLATKFYWDTDTAAKESKMMNAAIIKEKLPAFAKALANRHHPNKWEEVLERTKQMLHDLGEQNTLQIEDYKTVNNSVLIMIGDKDKMITLDETLDVYKALPHANMAMIPNTQHPIEQVDLDCLTYCMKKHLL